MDSIFYPVGLSMGLILEVVIADIDVGLVMGIFLGLIFSLIDDD